MFSYLPNLFYIILKYVLGFYGGRLLNKIKGELSSLLLFVGILYLFIFSLEGWISFLLSKLLDIIGINDLSVSL